MPPHIALGLWFLLLVALLYKDPAAVAGASKALWIPVIWLFILGSRLPSQWLGGGSGGDSVAALEEGNPTDRAIFTLLMLAALIILMSRRFNWTEFFTRNVTLTIFLGYALVSFVWSDFPLVALKRWFRDFGNYLVILVAISEKDPLEGVRAVLRRFAYLIVPLSILLIKYFPELGKQYSVWTGEASFIGATTSKNMLGVACLVSGIFFFWDTLARWKDRKQGKNKQVILVNIAFIAMTWWLLSQANSATSQTCLAFGCLVIAAAQTKFFSKHSTTLKILVPSVFMVYLVLEMGFNITSQMAGAMGRDPTLTDRTKIWETVLNVHTNPLLGAGYESFWLGDRILQVWAVFKGVNECHNGYLELYKNLGLVGLSIAIIFLLASYGRICRKLSSPTGLARLSMGVWAMFLFFNVTEAGFRSGVMWLALLLTIIATAKLSPEASKVVEGDVEDIEPETVEFGYSTPSYQLDDAE